MYTTSIKFFILISIVKFSFENEQQDPEVDTPLGKIQGLWDVSHEGNSFKKFKGLKYASVVERFQDATPIDNYPENIYSAKKEGPACPQPVNYPFYSDEDCLFLNVYVPGDVEVGSNKSVMVWIHGGGWSMGCPEEYNGTPLAGTGAYTV